MPSDLAAAMQQLIQSVNDALNGRLDLGLQGGLSSQGVGARIALRLLGLTAAIRHNRTTGQPLTTSWIADD